MIRTMKATDSSTTEPPADKMPVVALAERRQPSRPMARAALKGFAGLLLSFLCLTLTSCVREFQGCAGDLVIDNHFLKEFDPDNARFELPTAAVQPASLLWMKKGEVAGLRWDTFEFHWQQVGSMCSFTDNTSTNDCSICDYCTVATVGAGVPCFGALPLIEEIQVFASEGGSDPKLVEGFGGNDFVRGCPGRNPDPSNPQLSFEPGASAFYEMRHPAAGCTDKVFARANIRLVEADNPQSPDLVENTETTAYQLMPQTVDGTRYWTWSVTGDPKWLENFSRNLRITGVSIRKGTCVTDPVSGSCLPSEESPAVTASRILFLPDFQGTVSGNPFEATNRCYAHPSAIENGVFIDLDRCRNTNSPDPLLPTSGRPATPTYDHTQELVKLTWLVELNTGEGGDADLTTPCNRPTPASPGIAGCDAPAANEDLIIVFTIAAR